MKDIIFTLRKYHNLFWQHEKLLPLIFLQTTLWGPWNSFSMLERQTYKKRKFKNVSDENGIRTRALSDQIT